MSNLSKKQKVEIINDLRLSFAHYSDKSIMSDEAAKRNIQAWENQVEGYVNDGGTDMKYIFTLLARIEVMEEILKNRS